MDSYFEKHTSLLDADFHDFLAHELPLGFCKGLPLDLTSMLKMSILQRHLIGEGSHRHIISSFKISFQPGIITELPIHSCDAIIIERLPSGVFADPFELKHLVDHGVFKNVAVLGDTNLELPSALSNRSTVEVHINISHNILSIREEGIALKIKIPLHARYPPLDASGYSVIQMNLPDLFINCSIEGDSFHRNCLWKLVTEGSESATSIVWKMPSGNMEHTKFVSSVTFISALSSALLIVVTSVYSFLIKLKSKHP